MEKYLEDGAATEALGFLVGSLLQSGDVVCLSGELGAGKTSFSRGAAAALGVDPMDVNSPTFTIMNIYRGWEAEIRHFDLYRINRAEELEDIGFEEYAGGNGVTLIEWAELFSDRLPEEYLSVRLEIKGSGRTAILTAKGSRYEKILQEAEARVDFSD